MAHGPVSRNFHDLPDCMVFSGRRGPACLFCGKGPSVRIRIKLDDDLVPCSLPECRRRACRLEGARVRQVIGGHWVLYKVRHLPGFDGVFFDLKLS